jgi:hypothetical protein
MIINFIEQYFYFIFNCDTLINFIFNLNERIWIF